MTTRYFIRSRRRAREIAGWPVPFGFREMDEAEAAPHLRARERKERARRERDAGCVNPHEQRR